MGKTPPYCQFRKRKQALVCSPCSFRPTSNSTESEVCYGFTPDITNPQIASAYKKKLDGLKHKDAGKKTQAQNEAQEAEDEVKSLMATLRASTQSTKESQESAS